MFENIGKKIKGLASVVTWLGVLMSFVIGIIIFNSVDSGFLAFVIILGGSLISWISSFFLYGFGQLIDNSDKLVRAQGMEPYDSQPQPEGHE